MKTPGGSLVDRIGLALLSKALSYGTLFATAVVALSLFALNERHKFPGVTLLVVLDLLVGFWAMVLAIPAIMERMRRDDAVLLSDAIGQVFRSYLMLATYLPVIGPWLERMTGPRQKKNPFTQD